MLYLVQWTLDPTQRDAVQATFLETGAPPPDGVEMLGRWHRVSSGGGLLIAQSDDPVAIGRWVQQWSHRMRFEVQPVLVDAELAAIIRG